MTAQTSIPGTERTKNKKVTKAAEAYRTVRDERMQLTRKEVEAKQKLIEVMKAEKLEDYIDEDADLHVVFTSKENVRVCSAESDIEDEDEN